MSILERLVTDNSNYNGLSPGFALSRRLIRARPNQRKRKCNKRKVNSTNGAYNRIPKND